MRATRLRKVACSLTLCLGGVALFNCTLDTNGSNEATAGQGVGGQSSGGEGLGGESGNTGLPVGGAAGEGAGATGGGAGSSNAGAGVGGSGTAGAGQGGSAGVGGAGGGGGSGWPGVLGCKVWPPDHAKWKLVGDATKADGRIELTPATGLGRWGQAYLDVLVDADNKLEIAFAFTFTPAPVTGGYAEGAAFWLSPGQSAPQPPPSSSQPTSLGVPATDAGVAFALDMNDNVAPPSNQLTWGFYNSGYGGSNLGQEVVDQEGDKSVDVTAFASPGPHIATLQMIREGGDDLGVSASLQMGSGNPTLSDSEPGRAGIVFDGGLVGFSAGSSVAVAGAAHALLGVEIKIDGTCFDPP